MNKRIITGLVVLMGVSILGIIIVQLVWMNNAIAVKNELFNRSVNEALNNTVYKLEDIHNFDVVNRMVFDDSAKWNQRFGKDFDMEFLPFPPDVAKPDSLRRPPRPVHIIREVSPRGKNTRVEIRIDSDSKTTSSAYSYRISSDSDSIADDKVVVMNGRPALPKNVFVMKSDTIISDLDSLYDLGKFKIDSVITNLDTFHFLRPDISQRARFKAGRLKQMANQVTTEIYEWDVRRIDEELVQKVLREELNNRNIPIDFKYGIWQDSLMLDKEIIPEDSVLLMNSEYKVNMYPNDIFQKNIKLSVVFPGRSNFIYRSLSWLLMASFMFSIFILVTFALSIFYILRQKKISEMKSDFINNMTHEFKTPIATISVATDSIVNDKVVSDPERIRFFAGMIKKENTRMNRQVEDILTIARLDRKEFEFNWETLNTHELIDDAIQGIMLQVEKRNGAIIKKLNAPNPMVTTDKNHFTNVIFNLFDNAIKYSVEAPEIKITTTNKTNGVLISVSDNGIGMTKAVQSKIFERFYRQSSGNIHNVKGFGLGLSYVKAVVEANKGTISVHSEPGKGSKFDVFLPFVRE
ncbi:MAG: HAMP domain-containing sensor histidine kinase [Draconibacterium sp.]